MKRAFFTTPFLSAAGLLYAHNVEPDALGVTHLTVPIPGWKHPDLAVGHIADLHCVSPHSVERTVRATKLLLAQNPDIVFLTGDYISRDAKRWAAPAARALAPLAAAPGGAYAVLGNHDWSSGDPDLVALELQRVGFTVLRNRSLPIPGKPDVWVVGLDDRLMNQHNAEQALQNVPEHTIKLLLVHEPDYADDAPDGMALQFSGHSHGGQVRIPGLPPLHEPRYAHLYPEGLQQSKKHRVFTTRGVGMTGMQYRFCCPPEVVMLRLTQTA